MAMHWVLLFILRLEQALGITCSDGTDTLRYAGSVNVTNGGRACQPWHEQRPHQHDFTDDNFFQQDGAIQAAENFCRNPDGDPDPWCYTNDPYTKWQYCHGQICDEDAVTCGGILETSEYDKILYFTKITPGFYNTLKDCLWTLQAPSDTLIVLNFLSVDLECGEATHIQIYEPGFNHGKVCSNDVLPTITSKSNILHLQFACACFEKGFHVTFNHFVPSEDTEVVDPNCGGVITEPQAIIQNRDRDGDGMYDVIDYCVWTIVAPEDTVIKIQFEMLDTQFHPECRTDFLEIYDEIKSYGTLCGGTKPGFEILSFSNEVSLRFFSDFETTGNGFRLVISHVNTDKPVTTPPKPDGTPTKPDATPPKPDFTTRPITHESKDRIIQTMTKPLVTDPVEAKGHGAKVTSSEASAATSAKDDSSPLSETFETTLKFNMTSGCDPVYGYGAVTLNSLYLVFHILFLW